MATKSWADELVGTDVASAGLHISECISRDAATQPDLEEALEASRYSSHPYLSHPKEWPPLMEMISTRDLPPVLIERYNAAGGEGTALCGIFPEIRRAWASVGNSFFMWRLDKGEGQCQEYNGEEQEICAVGLAKSKPGVFIEAIQYLLVLATPLELILVGVCCTSGGDGADPFAEIALQPLPEYTLPSDGVTMTCITSTDKGHIFMSGRDGHIYEIQYNAGSGWHKHCRKLCLTSGLGSFISRWVLPNAFNFKAADSVIEMAVDNERHILYTRTEGMKLQVFDLGPNGNGPFKKIAEEKNVIDPHEAHYGVRRSGTSRSASRASVPAIVSLAPISNAESKWLHLVAVLSDGRRLYLSTSSCGTSGSLSLSGSSSDSCRPNCLKVVASRPSPPFGVSQGFPFGAVSVAGRTQHDDHALKVETAFYSVGTLVLSDVSSSLTSSLLVVTKDSSMQSSTSGNLGMNSRGSHALREAVSSLPIEGRMLFVAEVLPPADAAVVLYSLYVDSEIGIFNEFKDSLMKSMKLWARGELQTQHILPRRRFVVFSTMGMIEVAFNRPVDILRRLLESNAPRQRLEDFFNRYGAGEAASMCLMIASQLVSLDDNIITNTVAERAAEAFEDPKIIGMPQLNGNNNLPTARAPVGGFSMGQVVQETEPVFSAAYDGLCLCSSRLLLPIWELPIMTTQGSSQVITCRLSAAAAHVLESKIRALEIFLRSRRNKRRGLYGYVASLGDFSGSILYGPNSDSGGNILSNKRQRFPYSQADLAAMEVRAMECVRRMLRRSSEALFLLQLISQHNATRLVQNLESNARQKLIELTFHQLVCSEEGNHLASRLISLLIEYYVGPDGRGTVDEISMRLKEGCPSYFQESDYKYFLAVECLEKASLAASADKENLAREAFNLLTNVPDSVDLSAVCKRFEELRFYEAVVRLPLQKAQCILPSLNALNGEIKDGGHGNIYSLREKYYVIITNALLSLKRSTGVPVDPASRDKYIRQIVQLCVQWPDDAFHHYIYRSMIEMGLENELLEFGGPDLVPFLQTAGNGSAQEAPEGSSLSDQRAKYWDLLARYYVMKRQHLLAANTLYMLAEKRSNDGGLSIEQRCQYLSKAVLQAKSVSNNSHFSSLNASTFDDGLLDMLEAKLSVLQFQMKIKEELSKIASRLEHASESDVGTPSCSSPTPSDINAAKDARDKAAELSYDLKSITQLYNEYATPFQLWEICLEILSFANYSGDADSKIVREIWARLLDQALSRGGIAEACAVLKRVESKLYSSDGVSVPLDALCLHLEKAAQERSVSGLEIVVDEDIPRALLAACKDSFDHVLNNYDKLLSTGAILSNPNLKLRLLRSILSVLRDWSMATEVQSISASKFGTSHVLGDNFTTSMKQGVRDKILSAANRYMTEVRRLALPQSQTETLYRGFRELEERLLSPFSV